jgi:hypothetical protein
LHADLREAVVLHYMDGWSQGEIGSALGLSREAVNRRIQHGLAVLRKHLAKSGLAAAAGLLPSLLQTGAAVPAPPTLQAALAKLAAQPFACVSAMQSAAHSAAGVASLKVGVVAAGIVLVVGAAAGGAWWLNDGATETPAGTSSASTPGTPAKDGIIFRADFNDGKMPAELNFWKKWRFLPAGGLDGSTCLDVFGNDVDKKRVVKKNSPPGYGQLKTDERLSTAYVKTGYYPKLPLVLQFRCRWSDGRFEKTELQHLPSINSIYPLWAVMWASWPGGYKTETIPPMNEWHDYQIFLLERGIVLCRNGLVELAGFVVPKPETKELWLNFTGAYRLDDMILRKAEPDEAAEVGQILEQAVKEEAKKQTFRLKRSSP